MHPGPISWADKDCRVTGYVHYSVNVHCPHCDRRLDLTDFPYEDDENELGLAVFGGVDILSKWSGLNLEFICNHCKEDFVLTDLAY